MNKKRSLSESGTGSNKVPAHRAQENQQVDSLKDAMKEAGAIAESVWSVQLSPAIARLGSLGIDHARIAQVQVKFQRNIAPILNSWQQWYASFAPLAQALSKWHQQVTPVLQDLAPVLSKVHDFLESWRRYIEEETEVAEAFKSGHLVLAPSMPPSLVGDVTSFCRAREFKNASREISNYYRKNGYHNLKRVVHGWSENGYFRPRMSIIQDALEAHKQRKYTLSVPALLPQVEGIASDISKKSRKLLSRHSRARLGKTKAIVVQVVEAAKPPFGRAMHETLLAFIDEPLYRPRDFEAEYGTIRKHTGLSRHGILHGLQIRYANYTNSLRLFLVLDILFYLAEEIDRQATLTEKKT